MIKLLSLAELYISKCYCMMSPHCCVFFVLQFMYNVHLFCYFFFLNVLVPLLNKNRLLAHFAFIPLLCWMGTMGH